MTSDLDHCKEMIRHGSYSFHAASKLLPAKVRDPALALYAFCRVADDAVDLQGDKKAAIADLSERLDLVYRSTPRNHPTDRAFAAMVEKFEMPRALPLALLEGLEWDAQERRYQTLSDVRAYSARVASAVGVMMCVIMKMRDRDVLARACDLGVAMQLTNIARDVGEDALEGRLYLPLDWMAEAGIEPEAFLREPTPRLAIRHAVQRLLKEARALYIRCDPGIERLPLRSRGGIFAARHIYAAIGTRIEEAEFDSITRRARTTKVQKLGFLGLSTLRTGISVIMPKSPRVYAKPLEETRFLIDAATEGQPAPEGRSDRLFHIMANLKQHDTQNQKPPLSKSA